MFKYLIQNGGQLTMSDVVALSEFEPDFPVVVKFHNRPRGIFPAKVVPTFDRQDVRDVFVSAEAYSTLCELMQIKG